MFRDVLEFAPDAFTLSDIQGKIVHINAQGLCVCFIESVFGVNNGCNTAAFLGFETVFTGETGFFLLDLVLDFLLVLAMESQPRKEQPCRGYKHFLPTQSKPARRTIQRANASARTPQRIRPSPIMPTKIR